MQLCRVISRKLGLPRVGLLYPKMPTERRTLPIVTTLPVPLQRKTVHRLWATKGNCNSDARGDFNSCLVRLIIAVCTPDWRLRRSWKDAKIFANFCFLIHVLILNSQLCTNGPCECARNSLLFAHFGSHHLPSRGNGKQEQLRHPTCSFRRSRYRECTKRK